VTQKFRDEGAELLRFGGGINSRSSEDQIHPLECASGENFQLNPGNGEFKPRLPFDKVGTVPNAAEIRGLVTLQKTDGTVTMLVQAGTTVYSWDGADFISVGTVNASAKLRGPREAFWALDDVVIITDVNLAEEIHTWDGSTLTETTFLQSDEVSSFGNFRARYCVVENERAFFANIYESGSPFPHLLVSSKRSNYLIVSASDRPASGLGADAPWFLPTPQLKPINGMAFAFGVLALSQQNGAFEKLIGSTSEDFALDKLHHGSGSVGFESVVATSNDIVYGSAAHIESLKSTDKFGDVEFDDISFKVRDDIEDVTNWTIVYNERVFKVYCFPEGRSEVWVLHLDFLNTELSPWSKWTTQESFSFKPTATMTCRDPVDRLEYVFMGDALGNLYKLEGSGLVGDAGTSQVIAKRTSNLISAKLDAKAFKIHGWLQHRKNLTNTAELRFLFAGENTHDVVKTVSLSPVIFDTVYAGDVFYAGDYHYGAFQENRLVRRIFATSGSSNQFQVEVKVEGNNDFALTEIGLRFDQAG